ncbi:unnamed protein product [Cercopithifilaria johnstoni]|uniref:Uncharacterized protein n=1 Tax=Cercopithifilaria johnstoni TaxID=2874296 RepID=A0A8J2Q0Z7_9BILA|nr:unnamed protein product [Cercopithifilaria johnstoni]
MGNIGSVGTDIKERSKLALSHNEASSSRPQLTRRASQPVLRRNPSLNVSSQGRKISVLALSQRQLVKGCMDRAKNDIAEKIYRRIIEKRDDFRKFIEALSQEQRYELANELRGYLKNVVNRLADRTAVQRISEDFGAQHAQYRSFGFRPDFFAVTADAITTECVLLDAAMHPASEALFAWSTLTTFMFSYVRDGYYSEQRRVRKTSQQHINRSKILFSDASIDAFNQLANERRDSSISYNSSFEYDADETNELEISKSTTKRMEEEEVQYGSKEATQTTTVERIKTSDIGEESKDSIQTAEKVIPEDKYMTSDIRRQLRIAFRAHHNFTI